MTSEDHPGLPARARLVLVALLPVAALALAYASSVLFNAVEQIGPFDRAVLGWAVTIPLLVVAPALAALAPAYARGREGIAAILLLAAAIAIFATWRVQVVEAGTGCQPTGNPLDVLLPAALVGLTGGASFATAALSASRLGSGVSAGRRLITTLAYGSAFGLAGGFVTLLVYGLAFRPAGCAPGI